MNKFLNYINYSGSTGSALYTRMCSVKNIFLKVSQNSQENTCARVSFLIKLQTAFLAQVFSCEFSEVFKNTFLDGTPPVSAFVVREF